MLDKIDVLDHGYVRLVDSMGSDLSIVRSARVSYAAEPRQNGEDDKLLRYLLKNKHTSPFESVVFTFEVSAPIFVLRQWHRHRTWSYNEVSARYTQLPNKYYIPALADITTQHSSNKQMRTLSQHPSSETLQKMMERSMMQAYETYETLIEAECPREIARSVLPLSMYSTMFATVDLHNLMHFLRLRLHEHAQLEIRVYAEAILQLITEVVPTTAAIFRHILEEEGVLK